MKPAATMPPMLLRPRDAAAVLAVSERQIDQWRRDGLLTPVRIPGIRAVRFSREQVEELARSWCQAAGASQERTAL